MSSNGTTIDLMQTYVALVRGVNLRFHNKVSMADLLVGREGYLYLPDGYGRTKLGNTSFEKELGVTATTRTWRTVSTLVELTGA